MKGREGWRRHLRELVNASLDPMVYAVQWAHDPRCIQRGPRHRRVGAFTRVNTRVCKLWSSAGRRDWS